VEADQLSGTLLVGRGDQVVFERAFGFANLEHRVPNTPTTRHCIASITKPMTQVIAVGLIEEEKLDFDATLADFVPDFPEAESITVQMLASHRAGIPHRLTSPDDEAVPRTAADMLELARDAELLFEPGTDSIYSSGGYAVLARVLELAGGAPYEELLDDYVCTPADLVRTSHVDSIAILPDRASSYMPTATGWRNAALKDYSFLVGAGSVYSTARELFRFQRAVVDGDYGPLTTQIVVRGRAQLAWNGQTGGFRSFCDYDAATGITVVLTANRIVGANDLVRAEVPALAAGEERPLPEVPTYEPVELPPAALAGLEGRYQLRPGSEMTLRVAANGELLMNDWLLIPVTEGRLYSPQDYAFIDVERDDHDQVTKLDWRGFAMPRLGPAVDD